MISYSLNLICMTMNGIIAKNIEQNVDSSLHYISPLHQYIWRDIYPNFWGSHLDQQIKIHAFDEIFREILLYEITGTLTPQLTDVSNDLRSILAWDENHSNFPEAMVWPLQFKMHQQAIWIATKYMNLAQQEKILAILGYDSSLDIIKQNRRVVAFIEWRDDDKPISSWTEAIRDNTITRTLHCVREARIQDESSDGYRRRNDE